MGRTLQIRNVPDDVHATVHARAAQSGVSVSRYLLDLITKLVSVPTMAEIVERANMLARAADGAARADGHTVTWDSGTTMPPSTAPRPGTQPKETPVNILRLGPGDDDRVHQASHLFDDPPREDATRRFLEHPDHHLFVAYEDDSPAGFVSGVEITHPDKGTEMFLYELAVDERFQRRGIGRALTEALAGLARERGCTGMFVLTAHDNDAALATYRSTGAVRDKDSWVMLDWTFGDG